MKSATMESIGWDFIPPSVDDLTNRPLSSTRRVGLGMVLVRSKRGMSLRGALSEGRSSSSARDEGRRSNLTYIRLPDSVLRNGLRRGFAPIERYRGSVN